MKYDNHREALKSELRYIYIPSCMALGIMSIQRMKTNSMNEKKRENFHHGKNA
jgi:hypothetical protein